MIPFPEWRPDVSSVNAPASPTIENVLPQADGYGPAPSFEAISSALGADCLGAFRAIRADGSVAQFAATATALWLMDNTTLTWSDVTRSAGAYTAPPSDAIWSFAQHGDDVIAAQQNDAPQRYTLSTSSQFADLAGSPPNAAYVATVNRYLVLGGIQGQPRRVQWSDLNDVAQWSSGDAGQQDLPSGGSVMGIVGGEFGMVIQQSEIRRMLLSLSDAIFQIERIARDVGCEAPYSIVDVAGAVFLWSTKGFLEIGADGSLNYIGRERVDRYFRGRMDPNAIQLVQSASDPRGQRVLFTSRLEGSSVNAWDQILAFDTSLRRWAPMAITGQALCVGQSPGLTLEGLDNIGRVAVSGAADNGSGLVRLTVVSTADMATGEHRRVFDVGGTTEANANWTITVVDATHIDLQGSAFSNAYTSGGYVGGILSDIGFSPDSVDVAGLAQIGAVSSNRKFGFLSGANLEATLQTSEQTGGARRHFVSGAWPRTDAENAYVRVGKRESPNGAVAWKPETAMRPSGYCPARASARLSRYELRIPAGEAWSFAQGVEADVRPAGRGR